jgi:hypothetical protein
MNFKTLMLPFVAFSLFLTSNLVFADTCPVNDPTTTPGIFDFNGVPPSGWNLVKGLTPSVATRYEFLFAYQTENNSIVCYYAKQNYDGPGLQIVKTNVKPIPPVTPPKMMTWAGAFGIQQCGSDIGSGVTANDCSFEVIEPGATKTVAYSIPTAKHYLQCRQDVSGADVGSVEWKYKQVAFKGQIGNLNSLTLIRDDMPRQNKNVVGLLADASGELVITNLDSTVLYVTCFYTLNKP